MGSQVQMVPQWPTFSVTTGRGVPCVALNLARDEFTLIAPVEGGRREADIPCHQHAFPRWLFLTVDEST